MAGRLLAGWRFRPKKLRDTLVPRDVLRAFERTEDYAQVDLILPAIVHSLGEGATTRERLCVRVGRSVLSVPSTSPSSAPGSLPHRPERLIAA